MKQISLVLIASSALALTVSAQTWHKSDAPGAIWQGVATSADGVKMVAVASAGPGTPGPIYVSTDSGMTWTKTSAPTLGWSGVASSADGTRLVAVAFQNGVYASSDSGGSWTKTSAPNKGWFSVTSSADGSRLVATVGAGGAGGSFPMYQSSDFGTNWTQTTAPLMDWTSVACSSDGTKLVAGAGFGPNGIWLSPDSGSTWNLATNLPTVGLTVGSGWVYVASSADGAKLVAATQNAGIYASTDFGASWAVTSAPTNLVYRSLACSADGKYIVAVAESQNGGVYVSDDSGSTWTTSDSPDTPNGGRVAISANGGTRVVAVYPTGIYVCSFPPIRLLKAVKPSFFGLELGTKYQLQVSTDLSSWRDEGTPFIATEAEITYAQYWDVEDWGKLYFRLVVSP